MSASQQVFALAAHDASGAVSKIQIERRALGEHDIFIRTTHCGICHSDIHQARSEWGPAPYPLVPGHEIVGVVEAVGSAVSKFTIGQRAGVGCFTDSCRSCRNCGVGDDHLCPSTAFTYGYRYPDGSFAHGGYSQGIVVDQRYALSIPEQLASAGAAPLLCAGITVYSPIKHYGVRSHHRVGVLGLGGLGHMAVKILGAMGCHVTVLSTSPSKRDEALALGASQFVLTNGSADELKAVENSLDYIIDTVSADHDVMTYAALLRHNATIIVVGVPSKPFVIPPFALIMKRIKIGGSLIGGIAETQEMLDFCARHGITADVEVIPASYVNKAFERVLKSDVHYRFCIDMSTLTAESPEVETA